MTTVPGASGFGAASAPFGSAPLRTAPGRSASGRSAPAAGGPLRAGPIVYTEEQLTAITAPLEPGVIVAGAGSGKTTVMAARVVWLVREGLVEPGEVLGLTFTNKAAGELRERVLDGLRQAGLLGLNRAAGHAAEAYGAPYAADPGDDRVAETTAEPVISTYHAYARALIKEHGLRLAVEPSTQLLGDARRFTLAAAVVRAAAGPFEALTSSVPDIVRDLIDLDGQLSEHVVDPDTLRAHDLAFIEHAEQYRAADGSFKRGYAPLRAAVATARERVELLTLVEDYRVAKQAREVMDFGDQMAFGTRLAEQAQEVGRIERAKYRVVLLDEYQDTSVAQRRMLVALFSGPAPVPGEDPAGSGFGHAVTAVGDPCQSIYGWRGASASNIDHFPDHFPRRVRGAASATWHGAPARVYTLTENRRSGGRLLAFANARSAELRARHTGVSVLKPMAAKAEFGAAVAAVLPDYRAEITWIGDQIEALRSGPDVRPGPSPSGPASGGLPAAAVPWHQVAVLVRKGAHIPELYAELHGRGIPVEVVGLSGLLHLPEIADLTAMLDVIDDPIANASLVRLLTGPRWRIGPRDLALLGRRARQLVRGPFDGAEPVARLEQATQCTDPIDVVSLCDAVEDPGDELPFSAEALARFERFAAEIRRLRRSLSEPVIDLLRRILQETGLDVEIAASPEACRRRCADTVGAFLSVAADFTSVDAEQSATAFRAFLQACAEHERGLDIDLPPTDDDTVKILTMHKAKGLEWEVVVVPHQIAEPPKIEPWTGKRSKIPNALRGDAAELAVLGEGLDTAAFNRFTQAVRDEARLEDERLSYVTLTRPRSKLIVSAHRWGPSQQKAREPSAALEALRRHCADDPANGELATWAEPPGSDERNPALDRREVHWPLTVSGSSGELRREAARAVYRKMRLPSVSAPEVRSARVRPDDRGPGISTGTGTGTSPGYRRGYEQGPGERFSDAWYRAVADGWDADIEALIEEAHRGARTRFEVPMPVSLSATRLLALAADERAFAEELYRPMPRPPAPQARRGTEFHAWVDRQFGQQTLFDEADLVLFEDEEEIDGAEDLAELKRAFLRNDYARRRPYCTEVPFQLALHPPGAAPVIVRGRIDAVYRVGGASGRVDAMADDGDRAGRGRVDPGHEYEVVDWKTSRRATADPLQLAVYRIAWAERVGVPVEAVTAAFLYVRTGEVVRPARLVDRAELESLVAGQSRGEAGARSS